ncbi:hypothetical protein [Edaphobacter bradus]|uniref:hypothetical protein n=1 Tax=Edaphobacter bradus TaxID=2259016 RepID=UPI0021DFAA9F|nr:hypothetical protein [Edaphobacter bradus]
MLNQTRFNTEPTPVAIVPQAVKTPPPQPVSGDTRDTVSTVQSNGDRPRSENNGTVPTPLLNLQRPSRSRALRLIATEGWFTAL